MLHERIYATCKKEQVFPQSHLGRARRYPQVGECTLPLRMLVVTCRGPTMHNEALRKRYRALRNVTEALRVVM